MHTDATNIPGLYTLTPRKYDDERGFFAVPFNVDELAESIPGVDFTVKQISHSRSVRGVLRGMHAEPWHKYVYIARGEIFVAIVDLREGDNFGTVFTVNIPEGRGIFIPEGCGNSFQVLSDEVDYIYAVSGLWQAGITYPAVSVYDPVLAIDWPIKEAIISEKDQKNPLLSQFQNVD